MHTDVQTQSCGGTGSTCATDLHVVQLKQQFRQCETSYFFKSKSQCLLGLPTKCTQIPTVQIRVKELIQPIPVFIHNPTLCRTKSTESLDCDCCATAAEASCAKLGSGEEAVPAVLERLTVLCNSVTLEYRYKCLVPEASMNYELYDPSYSSGLQYTWSIKNKNKLGATFGRGRLTDPGGHWTADKNVKYWNDRCEWSKRGTPIGQACDVNVADPSATNCNAVSALGLGATLGVKYAVSDNTCVFKIGNPGYWRISLPKTEMRKVIGFAVMDAVDKMEWISSWFLYGRYYKQGRDELTKTVEVIVNGTKTQQQVKYWGAYYNKIHMQKMTGGSCPTASKNEMFYAHQNSEDHGKRMDFLFTNPIVSDMINLIPQEFHVEPSARMALLVEKETSTAAKTSSNGGGGHIQQFGLKFKGHIYIEAKGTYTFRVGTSHPFQLAINGQSLMTVLQAGIGTNSIDFVRPGYYVIEANYFYYGQYDSLGAAYGSDTPLLHIDYKFEAGVWQTLDEALLNRVGEPTSPPCPTNVNQMRIDMLTEGTTLPSHRTCSLRELTLTTLMQWSTSYKIFLMAHDRMPSSFSIPT